MPQQYDIPHARLERLRCIVARCAFGTLLSLTILFSRLLPSGHPARIFIVGRVDQLRETLLPAVIPASAPRTRAQVLADRAWIAMTALIALSLLGDVSAAIPVDPFGIPDHNLRIGQALGLAPDELTEEPHLFSTVLPWANGSPLGAALLLGAVASVYTWRPSRRRALQQD